MAAVCLSVAAPDCGNVKVPGTNVCQLCLDADARYIEEETRKFERTLQQYARLLTERGWTVIPPVK